MGPGTIAALETLLVDIAGFLIRFSVAPPTLMDRAIALPTGTITFEKIRHPLRAASASDRGRRLERSLSRSSVNNV